MAVGCGAACAKMLLFVFNFVFWLSGAGLIAVGIWFLVAEENAYILEILGTSSEDELMTVAAWAVIGIGVLVFVIGFLGCCGAIKESKCMLITYFICLLIILVAEVGAGVMAVVYKDSITEFMDEEIPDSLKTAYNDPTMESYTEAWDWMQVTLECCGYTSVEDYSGNIYLSGDKVPVTCCTMTPGSSFEGGSGYTPLDKDECMKKSEAYYNTKGCKDEIVDWIENNILVLIGVAFAVAGLEIFGMIFAICLCQNTDKDNEVV